MKHLSTIALFFAFPMIVLLAHLVASKVFNLYMIFPNLDILSHYVGGLAIAYTSAEVLSYLEEEKIIHPLNKWVFLTLIFCLTATAAVFWEFAEFIGDRSFHTNIQISLANTMQDQFMGVLGGSTWVFICFRKFEKMIKSRRPG